MTVNHWHLKTNPSVIIVMDAYLLELTLITDARGQSLCADNVDVFVIRHYRLHGTTKRTLPVVHTENQRVDSTPLDEEKS